MPARKNIPRAFRIMYMALRDAGFSRAEAVAYVNDGFSKWQQWLEHELTLITIAGCRAIEAHVTMGTYTDMPQRSRFVPLKVNPVKHRRKFTLDD